MSKPTSKSIRSRAKRGFNQFNVMIAGHENSGKTSFIKTVYHTAEIKNIHFNNEKIEGSLDQSLSFIPDDVTCPTPIEARIEYQSQVSPERVLLRLIDTPGLIIPSKKQELQDPTAFAESWLESICSFIESQYEATLLEESKVKRNPKSPDYQIHACLYFIDPGNVLANGGLTEIDRIVMLKLCSILNVVPCLGKSDLLSTRELARVKKMVMQDIARHDIGVQAFYDIDSSDEDESGSSSDEANVHAIGTSSKVDFKSVLPFALISGEEVDDEDRMDFPKWTLERKFPWGTANIENSEHCDFVLMKDMIFGLYLQDLKDITHDVFYEQWRTKKLMEVRGSLLSNLP